MNQYNLLCIFYLAFGAFFYGYDSGLTTSVIGYPQVKHTIHRTHGSSLTYI